MISSNHEIFVKMSSNCQGIGICLDGSKDSNISYVDPGYCIEGIDCPRNGPSSTIFSDLSYIVYDFQGVSVPRLTVIPNEYQRPALLYEFDVLTRVKIPYSI